MFKSECRYDVHIIMYTSWVYHTPCEIQLVAIVVSFEVFEVVVVTAEVVVLFVVAVVNEVVLTGILVEVAVMEMRP